MTSNQRLRNRNIQCLFYLVTERQLSRDVPAGKGWDKAAVLGDAIKGTPVASNFSRFDGGVANIMIF